MMSRFSENEILKREVLSMNGWISCCLRKAMNRLIEFWSLMFSLISMRMSCAFDLRLNLSIAIIR